MWKGCPLIDVAKSSSTNKVTEKKARLLNVVFLKISKHLCVGGVGGTNK